MGKIIVVFLLVSIILSAFLHIGGIIILQVSGESMKPTIEPGDHIIAAPVKDRVGSIVYYENPESESDYSVVHRIVVKHCCELNHPENNISYITKGDYNSVNDNYVLTDEYVKGRVLLIIRQFLRQ